jgi:hypothetical protein
MNYGRRVAKLKEGLKRLYRPGLHEKDLHRYACVLLSFPYLQRCWLEAVTKDEGLELVALETSFLESEREWEAAL